ncbi:hypothetical protein OX459_10540 [Janthinobacterium sp. SUN026]|uniref:hypothetical protein n=1 Tax=Janthinobacterium sp. SUN026 TaxID=3002438 RepID=UPI0025AF45A3|nr:hypothetical protein [Janthinobacterium sp. SUN026]MDN2671828.1 hypothetical protein [Janthinobacterium sp. SUN026]
MHKLSIIIVLLGLHGMAMSAPIADCPAELARQTAQVASMSLKEFDLTPDSGWRVLADAQCFSEAESILKRYLESNGPQSSLFIHLGQIELRLDKRVEAERNFMLALRPGDSANLPFKFNDFVLALAAYAAGDRTKFLTHYAIIERHAENIGNGRNLKLLTAIRDNFDRKYLDILNSLR